MKFFKLIFLALFSFGLIAGEHDLTNIKGTNIDLKAYDHAIAGSINGFLVFGNLDEEKGLSQLTIKKDGVLTNASFQKLTGKPFGGTIVVTTEKGEQKVDVQFKKLNREANIFTFTFNGVEGNVQVTADDFQNNHYYNPKYVATIGDKVIEFKMENGLACYNFSAHLISMIVGSSLL